MIDVRDTSDPAGETARILARRLAGAVARRGSASLALSGGSTAPPLLAALAALRVPWARVGIWQVDERVAPDGHPDRNASQLAGFPGRVRLMPVTARDLRAAARRYGAGLPERFDVVHLGVGDDGHTASWPPDRPEIARSDRLVEVTDVFNGHRRMTLTAGVVNGARSRVVLAPGRDKTAVLRRWLEGDDTLPVSWLHRTNTVLVCDHDAAPPDGD
jgi:6-phosphogluconolactonase/glucosamine-6-phosphate isomerase/deaminase